MMFDNLCVQVVINERKFMVSDKVWLIQPVDTAQWNVNNLIGYHRFLEQKTKIGVTEQYTMELLLKLYMIWKTCDAMLDQEV